MTHGQSMACNFVHGFWVINSLIDITPQGFPMMDDPWQPKKPCFDHGAQGKFGLNEPLNFGLKKTSFSNCNSGG